MIENLENRTLLAVINNGLAPGDTNFVQATVNGGGAISVLTFGSHQNVLFAYNGYLDLGGNATYSTARVIDLRGLPFSTPVSVNGQTAQSQATITLDGTGANRPQITIFATSHIDPGGSEIQTDYQFTSSGYNMGNAAFFQYLDADIRSINDDVFATKGSIANNNLEVNTVNPTEFVWVEQKNGTANSAALLSGYAADLYPNLITSINAGGFVPAPTGTINARLVPGTFPGIGPGFGPGDITSCTYYTLNSTSGNVISTRLGVINTPDQPLMVVTFNANVVPDGSTVRSTLLGTDFGTVLGMPVTHYFQIENQGLGELQLADIPAIHITGANPDSFIVTREPTQATVGGGSSFFAIQFLPTAAGVRTATVTIDSNDLTTTPYTFEVFGGIGTPVQPDIYEPDNTFAQAKVISTDGVWQYHSIHVNNDVDTMVFKVVQDGNVLIQTTAPIGDTMLRLYNANGQQIAQNNDYNPGVLAPNVTSRIQRFLTAGTYYIKVTEFGQNATIPLYGVSVRAGAALDFIPVTLNPNTGQLDVFGTNGPDNITVDVYQQSVRVVINTQMQFFPMTSVHSVNVYGLKGADTIFIGRGITNAMVSGGPGNDIITCETNTPVTVYGGAGDDSITGGSGGDFLFGGAGNDTIVGGAGNNYIQGDAGRDVITVGDSNNTVIGGPGNDSIVAGNGNNILSGGGGSDTIIAGNGNDTVTAGSAGGSILVTGTGTNNINAQNGEPDTIYTNSLTDVLVIDPNGIDVVKVGVPVFV